MEWLDDAHVIYHDATDRAPALDAAADGSIRTAARRCRTPSRPSVQQMAGRRLATLGVRCVLGDMNVAFAGAVLAAHCHGRHRCRRTAPATVDHGGLQVADLRLLLEVGRASSGRAASPCKVTESRRRGARRAQDQARRSAHGAVVPHRARRRIRRRGTRAGAPKCSRLLKEKPAVAGSRSAGCRSGRRGWKCRARRRRPTTSSPSTSRARSGSTRRRTPQRPSAEVGRGQLDSLDSGSRLV